MAYKLSPSALNLMKECPRCFWLHHHGVWRRPQGPFPSLPSGVDRVLKEHFDEYIGKDVLPPVFKDAEKILEELKGVSLFEDVDKLKIWRNNFEGIKISDEEGNVLFGAVDTILEKDGKLIVLDYKTRGFPLKENTIDYYKDQLDIYNLLLRRNGFETEDFSLVLFYIPKKMNENGEMIFETVFKKVPVDIENAERKWSEALRILKGSCPVERCDWCENVNYEG